MRVSFLPLVLVFVTPAAAAEPLQPLPYQPLVAGIVAAGLSEYHYEGIALDDDLSACWLDAYLDMLDPDRSLFSARDIAGFRRYQTSLDDAIRAMPPDISPAFAMHDRFRARASERTAWVLQAVNTPPDLTDDETIEIDRSKDAWPAGDAALHDVWRRELEEDWLRLSLDDEDTPEIQEHVRSRTEQMDDDLASTENSDVLEGWLDALTSCYDPHTTYLRPISADDFAISTSGSLEGIGAALRRDGDMVRVDKILPGGPAQRSHAILPDDKITGVAQGDEPLVDVIGMRLDKVVQLIRGPKGTIVRLEILPATAADPTERKLVWLERDRIDLESVEPTLELRDQPSTDGISRKIAIIKVPAFAGEATDSSGGVRPGTTQRVAGLILQAKGADTVIIDLRENGGGLLDEAVSMVGLFIDRGPVVQIRDRGGRIEVESDQDAGETWSGPLVILTSRMSASASEILTGALKDYGRAVVVGGDTTFGKGSVQTMIPLDPILDRFAPQLKGQSLGGVLKITFSQYYLPGGRSTQAEGISSDIALPSPYDGRIKLEGDRPHALPADTIAPAHFRRVGDLSPVIATLRARSEARVLADDRFTAMKEGRAWLDQQEKLSVLSLNLEKRRAERDARKKTSDALNARLGEDQDPVLDEAVAIAADLRELNP